LLDDDFSLDLVGLRKWNLRRRCSDGILERHHALLPIFLEANETRRVAAFWESLLVLAILLALD